MNTSISNHWTRSFTMLTLKQGQALDAIAASQGGGDGLGLLIKITGLSRHELSQIDLPRLRRALDEAFRLRSKKTCRI